MSLPATPPTVFKGKIKWISQPYTSAKYAIVSQYNPTPTGDVIPSPASVVSTIAPSVGSIATVTSTIAPAATKVASVTSTVAPNASEQFLLTSTGYNINITVDAEGPYVVDLSGKGGFTVSTLVSIDSIVDRINAAFIGNPASKVGTAAAARLKITGTLSTAAGVVTVAAGTTHSALAIVFGLTATDSGVTTECFDLSTNHFVNVTVDAVGPTNINIVGATPARTTITEIVAAINAVFPASTSKVGTDSAARITIHGATIGAAGIVTVAAGSTFSALTAVFNSTTLSDIGNVAGTFDLSTNHNVNITVDAVGPTTINIAGVSPANTTIDEIVAKINAVFTASTTTVGTGAARRIKVTGIVQTSSGVVTVDNGTTLSALPIVFNATALTAHGSTLVFNYEDRPIGYRPLRADFHTYSKGDIIYYVYNSGNHITFIMP